MSRQERYGTRSLAYSRWHRPLADKFGLIDIDAAEYCRACSEPLALIETTRDVGQSHKPVTVTRNLGRRADVPVYVAFYALAPEHPVECPLCGNELAADIVGFRLRPMGSTETNIGPELRLTPHEMESWLHRLHRDHDNTCEVLRPYRERATP